MVLPRPAGYWRTAGELGTLGLSFVLALVLGTWLGLKADVAFGPSQVPRTRARTNESPSVPSSPAVRQ